MTKTVAVVVMISCALSGLLGREPPNGGSGGTAEVIRVDAKKSSLLTPRVWWGDHVQVANNDGW